CNPQYVLLDEKGPDHAECFEVCVEIYGRRFSSAWANSKKEAEQKAALLALTELDLAHIDEAGRVHIRTAPAAGTAEPATAVVIDADAAGLSAEIEVESQSGD